MWIMTDDSRYQHVRHAKEANKIFGPVYELIEFDARSNLSCNYERCIVYVRAIFLDDYFEGSKPTIDLKFALGVFGHELEDVLNEYGDMANQIIAECIFEHEGIDEATIIFGGNKDD